MRGWNGTLASVAGAFSLLLATASNATPVTYFWTSGSAKITATLNGSSILPGSGSINIPVNGTFVQFDTAPLALTDFEFTMPNTVVNLGGILAGNSVTLSGVAIQPGAGYPLPNVLFGANPYTYTVGPVDVTGSLTGAGLLLGFLSLPGFTVTNPSLSGSVTLGGGNTLALNGITLGTVAVPSIPFVLPSGGTLGFKADLLFTGVPEPGTALLVGAGLAGLGLVRRRTSLN